MNKRIIPLFVFSLFGVIFLGLLIHEGIHIFQGKYNPDVEPYSLCYDIQQEKMFMHVGNYYDDEDKFTAFKGYSGKWADIGMFVFICGICFLGGRYCYRK